MTATLPRRDRRAFLPAFPHVRGTLQGPLATALVVAAAVLLAAAVGWFSVVQGPMPAAAIVAGLVAAVVVLSDPRAGIWPVVGVMTLLPFAVIPVRVGLTLTL